LVATDIVCGRTEAAAMVVRTDALPGIFADALGELRLQTRCFENWQYSDAGLSVIEKSKRRAVEVTVRGKAWKTKIRFSTLPTALGNRVAIPTLQQFRWPEEKWKAKSRLPTFPLLDDSLWRNPKQTLDSRQSGTTTTVR
jgi:hypothetical protein